MIADTATFATDLGGLQDNAAVRESTVALALASSVGFVLWLLLAVIAAVPAALIGLAMLATRRGERRNGAQFGGLAEA